MAQRKKVYGVNFGCSLAFLIVHGLEDGFSKSRKPVAPQSEIGNLTGLQLKLQFVCDKGDELRIRGFSLGVTDRISEKSLQRIQISSVPGHFDGMADSPFHSGRRGLECFRHLGV